MQAGEQAAKVVGRRRGPQVPKSRSARTTWMRLLALGAFAGVSAICAVASAQDAEGEPAAASPETPSAPPASGAPGDAAGATADSAAGTPGPDDGAADDTLPEGEAAKGEADDGEADDGKADGATESPKEEAAVPLDDAFGDLPAWEPAGGSEPAPLLEANWDAAASPAQSVAYPWVESHGYFRVRSDLFYNFSLGTYSLAQNRGTSPFLPPLTELDVNGSGHPERPNPCPIGEARTANCHTYRRGAKTQASTNMRFRYQPTFHLTENLRIKTTVDVLDNVVLGSTPDGSPRSQFQRPDVALETFSGSQRPPESGVNGWRDSLRVKHLWGEWRTPLGMLILGRHMSDWGLGILANGGNCLDCDFGDSVDRIMGVTKLFDTYLALSWDFVSEGAVGFPGRQHTLQNQPLGQPFDLDQRDDVGQWVIAIFQRPVTREEKEKRVRELNELRKPVFDWGVYNVIRNHTFEANYTGGGRPPLGGDDYELRDTKAFAYIPDAWARFEYRPRRGKRWHVELEAAAVMGVIEELPLRPDLPKVDCLDRTVTNIADCSAGQRIRPRKRDIAQWGYAAEFNAQLDKLKWGFHHGIASGDETDGFGVLDKLAIDPNDPRDQQVTNFRFDRDYFVDLILFREIIGTITNAAYFKPYISYDFIQQDTEAWGFQFAAIYSFAMEPRATPGNERPLGLEFDLELYIHEFDRFRWMLQYGLLFPLGAFDRLDPQESRVEKTPGIAQTLQMSVGMQF